MWLEGFRGTFFLAEIRLAFLSTRYESIIHTLLDCYYPSKTPRIILHFRHHFTRPWGCLDIWVLETISTSHFQYPSKSQKQPCVPGIDYLAIWLSPSVNTQNLRLVRSIRLARALRGIRIVWLFEYVGALRTLALSIISISDRGWQQGGKMRWKSQQQKGW